ncbi:MAG: nucleotidyltransferase domain-containing protein [Deltaproteobacteria bacterium]|nr:nucleotidyltransferase domain-containing protein [Deltaproteobacteria bacterium]
MRLSIEEKSVVVDAVIRFDPDARIYLFGSRVDDRQKGGDIDILVFSNRLTFKDKLKIKAVLFETMEDQKIDLVIAKDSNDPFVKIALEKGVRLN